MAQPAPAPVTVEEAVSQAVKNNPRLIAASHDVTAARLGVRSAGALANPEVTFAPGITSRFGSEQELLIVQPLELNGARSARTAVANAQLRRVQAEATLELRSVVAGTKTAYYELARAQAERSLAVDLLAATQEFDRLTRRQIELGSRPAIEKTQSGIEVVRARQKMTQAESAVTVALASLNTWMGRAPEAVVGALALLPSEPGTVDVEQAMKQALGNRAEIAIQLAARDEFQQQARLARAQGYPDLAPQFRAGTVTRGFGESGLGVSVSLPLFDYGGRRNRIRQAEESARAQSDRIASVQSQVRQEVNQAIARLKAAQATIKDYREGVLDQSRHLLNASRTGFEEGKTSLIVLLEAQRTYRSVQSEYLNALADQAEAYTEVERVTGAVPPSLLPDVPTPTRRLK